MVVSICLIFGKVASVTPGTLLIVKRPETLGKDGYTVSGETIKAIPGKPTKLVAGEGTEINTNKPNELIATQAGVSVEIKDGMRVDDIYSVANVSVKTGHIDFDGSVLITNKSCRRNHVLPRYFLIRHFLIAS